MPGTCHLLTEAFSSLQDLIHLFSLTCGTMPTALRKDCWVTSLMSMPEVRHSMKDQFQVSEKKDQFQVGEKKAKKVCSQELVSHVCERYFRVPSVSMKAHHLQGQVASVER